MILGAENGLRVDVTKVSVTSLNLKLIYISAGIRMNILRIIFLYIFSLLTVINNVRMGPDKENVFLRRVFRNRSSIYDEAFLRN